MLFRSLTFVIIIIIINDYGVKANNAAFSGFTLENAILLELTSKDSASNWTLEDYLLVHVPSGQVLSAHKVLNNQNIALQVT